MQDFISTDSTNNNVGNNVVGVAHAEPPSELANEDEVDVLIIMDRSIKFDELAALAADPTVVDIMDQCKYGERVRAAGVDLVAFQHIN
jgi:hypothetical protein